MTQQERDRVEAIIQTIARKEGKTPEEIRDTMQEAMDAAWAAAWQPGNISAQAAWQSLFPGALKPTLEEFIIKTASVIR